MRHTIPLALGLLLIILGHVDAQDEAADAMSSSRASLLGDVDEVTSLFTPRDDMWFTAEFLFGWIEGAHLAPLVTTSTATNPSGAGALDDPLGTVLLSGTVNPNVRPGFRLGAGYVYNKVYGLGVEAGFIFLPGQSTDSFSFSSTDHPILAQPFIDANSGDPDSFLVAFPDPAFTAAATGTIRVESKSGSFYTFNLDLTERVWDAGGWRIDGLLGYRFASIHDSIRISTHRDLLNFPNSVDSVDAFSARNSFNGIDLGFRATYTWNDRLSLNLLAKGAPGNMHRTVKISGQTTESVAGGVPPSTTSAAGLYALSSNIGRHTRNDWTVLPEAGANLNWQLRSNISLSMGYSLLYLTKVARADNQIDFTVNPGLIPGATPDSDPLRPAFQVHRRSDMWIQTLNLGLEVTF